MQQLCFPLAHTNEMMSTSLTDWAGDVQVSQRCCDTDAVKLLLLQNSLLQVHLIYGKRGEALTV